jgi:NHL repeat
MLAAGRAALECRSRRGTYLPLGLLAFLLCWTPMLMTKAATAIGYSETPSLTEPYAACPPPSGNRAQCQVIIDPRAPSPTFPATERAPSNPGASAAIGSAIFCREVFPGSEYEDCGSGADHGFSPQDLQSAYRLPSETAGAGQTVAIVDAYDDPDAQADLDVYRATYDLPPCESGCFTKVNQTGGTTYPEASTSWALEISLDLDMVSAACPKCHILLVEAKSETLENLGIAENEAATLGASEISNSYAANEKEVGRTQLEADSKYYAHPGLPITVASGDAGWDNTSRCTLEKGTEKCANVAPSFPAGLSTVIAVGGTDLSPAGESGRGWNESVWFYSGSGCTLYVAKPGWQSDKGCKTRTDNDIAAVAEGVSLYDTYLPEPGWQVVGGTSVATPLAAAAIALESSSLRSEGAEGIYKHPTDLFDVKEGDNHGKETCAPETYQCQAEVGYDGPTGVGTPDGGATASAPSAWTEPASGVTTTAASLNGIVDPEGGAETKYYFQYGASAYYGRMTPVGGAKVSGYTQPSRVSQAVSGLRSSTRYHFRVVAKSGSGTTYGADQVFSTAPYIYASKFASKGAAEGELDEPRFTAVNSEGDVWVSDYANDRVEEFSPSGAYIRACGKAGSGEVQFNGPTGIAVSRSGQLYISDAGNDRIEVISQSCVYWDSFGQGYLSDPMGLAFTSGGAYSRGLVLIANPGDNDIEEFSTNTEVVAGKYTQKYEGSYGSKGSGEGQFVDPTDVTAAGRENERTQVFYVVDSGNDRVQELSLSGLYTFGGEEKLAYKFDEAFGTRGSGEGQLSGPTAAAVDPSSGDLDITDTGNDRVEQFLPTGVYVAKFGSAGSGNSSFESPMGIAVTSAGRLYLADSLNNRVAVWAPSEVTSPEWLITSTQNPYHALDSYLWGVSCAGAGCSAVGDYTMTGGGESEPVAEWWNGIEWAMQSIPSPSEYSALYGVSCASMSWCVGVGFEQSAAGGAYASLMEDWTGTKWAIQATPEPSGALESDLDAVSCASTSSCTAVGESEGSTGIILPFALHWSGTEWKVQSVPAPTGAKEAFPTGISCTSSTACMLVGVYKSSAGVYLPYADTWSGTEWRLQSVPVPAGATATRLGGGVSCTSTTACTAVGYYTNSAGVQVTLAERWNGTEWGVQSAANPSEAKSSSLSGVSCTSATACTAVGVALSGAGRYVTLAEQWNGTEWRVVSTPNDEKGEGWLSGGVSCSGPESCLAVGNTGLTFAEVYG